MEFRDGIDAFQSLGGRQTRTLTLSGQGEVAERVTASVIVGDLFSVYGVSMAEGRPLAAGRRAAGSRARRRPQPPLLVQALRVETDAGQAAVTGRADCTRWPASCRPGWSWATWPKSISGCLSREAPPLNRRPIARGGSRAACGQRRRWPRRTRRRKRFRDRLEREQPETNRNWHARVAPTREAIAGPNTWLVLAILLTTVGLLLLLACANVMNMLLARLDDAAAGAGAFVWRSAPPERRIVCQLVTEALVLGAAGAAVGLAIGAAGMKLMRAFAYEPIFELLVVDTNVLLVRDRPGARHPGPVLDDPGDWRPRRRPADDADRGWHAKHRRPGRPAAVRPGRGAAHAGRHPSGGAGFVLQTMTAIMRLIRASSHAASSHGSSTCRRGSIPISTRFGASTSACSPAPPERSTTCRAWRRSRRFPSSSSRRTAPFEIAGQPRGADEDRPWAGTSVASHDYFEVAGIPVVQGRAFDGTDQAATEPVAVVSREAARRYWRGDASAAIGAHIRLLEEGPRSGWSARVVGIVADAANPNVDEGTDSAGLLPRRAASAAAVLGRAAGGGARGAGRRTSGAPCFRPTRSWRSTGCERSTMPSRDEQSSNTIIMSLFLAFALVALLLAASGLYGVMAFSVSRRAPGIAVRMALGASPRDIGWTIVSEGTAADDDRNRPRAAWRGGPRATRWRRCSLA